LKEILTKAGLSEQDFNACLSNQDVFDKINALTTSFSKS